MRTWTRNLAVFAIALGIGVGTVGCDGPNTADNTGVITTTSLSSGTTSTTTTTTTSLPSSSSTTTSLPPTTTTTSLPSGSTTTTTLTSATTTSTTLSSGTTTTTSLPSGSTTTTTLTSTTTSTTTGSITTTTIGSAGTYTVVFTLVDAVTLGGLEFSVDYSGAPGEFPGSADLVSCTSPVPSTIVVWNDVDSGSSAELAFAMIGLGGFSGPLVVGECSFAATTTPNAGQFIISVLDASDPSLNPVSPLPSVSVELVPLG